MGVIDQILGGPGAVAALGNAAKGVAEVFVPSATKRMELSAQAQIQALKQLAAEFNTAPQGWFDRAVDGLNRLPRPMLAFGTIGLFVYAMIDPMQFAQRMVGLNAVPDPLWWLLGAVVAFYFGSRETHYFRNRQVNPNVNLALGAPAVPEDNLALADWRAQQG